MPFNWVQGRFMFFGCPVFGGSRGGFWAGRVVDHRSLCVFTILISCAASILRFGRAAFDAPVGFFVCGVALVWLAFSHRYFIDLVCCRAITFFCHVRQLQPAYFL